MSELIEQELQLRKDVDELLYEKGLNKILEKYGEVYLTGSYLLKTMLKKDIDISLLNSEITIPGFFKLGGEVAAFLKCHGGHYRNTKEKSVNSRPPESLYWGFEFADWKIDLWIVPKYHLDESIEYSESIINKMDEEKRKLILEIKNVVSSNYNRKYSSKEIYDAVLEKNILSLEEFKNYLKNDKNCEL